MENDMLLANIALYGNIFWYKKRKCIEDTAIGSYMEACCLWVLFLFTLTEGLSVFQAVRFRFLFVAWGIADVLLLGMLVVQWRRAGLTAGTLRETCRRVWYGLKKEPYYAILLLIGATVLFLALGTIPYNWDSMTYHLPRIAYWRQNRSIAHYATNCIRQISSPVLAEFVNLHVYILCRGHDWFFNLLQAFSYITNAILVGAIAKKLSCDGRFRFLAMLLYMTMPIAFAEAVTTQVDNFAAVWLLFFVYRLLDYVDGKKNMQFNRITIFRVGTMGLSVAWGYLAKPSVCVGMVVFAFWLLFVCIRRKDRIKDLAKIFVCALPWVAVPMAPEILRNFKSFDAYASPSAGATQIVATMQPTYLFVNMLKNISFNMPTAFVKNGEKIFAQIAVKAASFLNVELNAEAISERGGVYWLHKAGTYNCDVAVNPTVFWLFVFCVLWTLLRTGKNRWEDKERGYFVAAALSFLIFCVILRWEPWVSRYMISYLALMCPLIAAAIRRGTTGKWEHPLRLCLIGLISLLCVLQACSLFQYHNDIRKSSKGMRAYGYFAVRPEELAVYVPLVDEIRSKHYDEVGLRLCKADDFEYPFWKMLDGCRLEHVLVKNKSAKYTNENFVPDCVIWFGPLPEEAITIGDRTYSKITEYGKNQYLLESGKSSWL